MLDLSLMAASEWARVNAPVFSDPVEFGHKVAQVYRECQVAVHHAGDEKATSSALSGVAVTLRDLIRMQAATTTKKLQALEWAQRFTESASLDQLVAGARACEAFFDEAEGLVGSGSPATWAALSAAAAIAMRSDAGHSWDGVIGDAREVLMHLCSATVSTRPLPCEAASNPTGSA